MAYNAQHGDSGKALLAQAYNGAPSAPGWGGATATATAVPAYADYGEVKAVEASSTNGWATATAVPATAAGSGGWGGSSSTAYAVDQHQSMPTAIGASAPAVAVAGSRYSMPVVGNPAPGSGVDAALFTRYADVVQQVERLNYVDQALAETNGKIQKNEATIHDMDRKLKKAHVDQPKLEQRIHRNENPRFLHYMQFNRSDKVARLKQDLDNMKKCQETWTARKHQNETELQENRAELASLTNSSQNRDSLRKQRQQMYDQVVGSVPPTLRLQQIDSNIQRQHQELRNEQELLRQVDSCVAMVRQGQQMFQRSQQMLRHAAMNNTTAQVMNFADGPGRRGPDPFERMQQAQRDRLINEAQQPAIQAYQIISQAFSMFPQEARRRYPELCSQIGHTPLPRLRGANFGATLATGMVFGDVGDMFNNMNARRKIEDNMQTVAQCNQIVEVQVGLIAALRSAIAKNIAAMEGQISTLKNQRKEEQDNIFQTVRSSVLNSQPSAVAYAYS